MTDLFNAAFVTMANIRDAPDFNFQNLVRPGFGQIYIHPAWMDLGEDYCTYIGCNWFSVI